jgi:hypothetical protein
VNLKSSEKIGNTFVADQICVRENQHDNAEVKNKRKGKGRRWAEKEERPVAVFGLSVEPLLFHVSVCRFLLKKINRLWNVTEFVICMFRVTVRDNIEEDGADTTILDSKY